MRKSSSEEFFLYEYKVVPLSSCGTDDEVHSACEHKVNQLAREGWRAVCATLYRSGILMERARPHGEKKE